VAIDTSESCEAKLRAKLERFLKSQISTLQADNAKLRAEVEGLRSALKRLVFRLRVDNAHLDPFHRGVQRGNEEAAAEIDTALASTGGDHA
jgi:hypothetical protein